MVNPNTNIRNPKKLRILVAEDNEINQKLILRILQKAEYTVDMVDNGREAVAYANRNQYDFILMDIQMPLMDGLEAAERIRNAECGVRNSNGENSELESEIPNPKSQIREVPIVAMTGSNSTVENEKCLRMGMNDCLGKPLFRDQILSSIKKWTATEPVGMAAGQTQTDAGQPLAKESAAHPPIDFDKVLSEFMGEREVLLGLLKEFTTKVRSQIKAIRQAITGMDFKAIAKDAHSIKGGAANLTAKKVAGLASALEKAADLQEVELAKNLAGELEKKLQQLENYMQNANISVNGA